MENTPYIIACEVFRPELEHLTKNAKCVPVVTYLKQGLHDTPDLLRKELQENINAIEEEYAPSKIFLAYGFCGRGLYGITSKKACLIIPKVHDCIPVLLGDGPDKELRPEEYSKTYWLSAGWIKYCQLDHIIDREKRFTNYVEQYGEDSADYLMEVELSWQNNYKECCLIKWDSLYTDQLVENALFIAKDMKLPYIEREASSWYLQELVDGGNNETHFFHLTPGTTLDLNEHGILDTCTITSLG